MSLCELKAGVGLPKRPPSTPPTLSSYALDLRPISTVVGADCCLVLSIQRAPGPGHRDGVGHRHVLPFPASEVHEDSLAAAGEVASGGMWLGHGQSGGCENRAHVRG